MAKKRFKLEVFRGCPVWAILKIKEGKATMKLFYHNIEVKHQGELESINKIVLESLILQSRAICAMNYAVLWNY